MRIRSTVPRLLLATVCGAAILYGPAAPTAPIASAAPCAGGFISDPVTGVCWSQSKGSIGISGTGGTCLPGRLGLCLGALQNSQIPGANLPTNPNYNSWP
ncbi:MAG: hypothetical protein WCH82_04715 [Mycobacteriaceae bacterium]